MKKVPLTKLILAGMLTSCLLPVMAMAEGPQPAPPAASAEAASADTKADDAIGRLISEANGGQRPGGLSEPMAGQAALSGRNEGEKTAPGGAIPAPLPKSGQTTCYSGEGTVMVCDGTGQDGATLKGIAIPTPRFTKHNNGTVTDNLTGLVWLANANCATLSPKSWTAAQTAVAALHAGDCGLSDGSVAGDWRLPNSRELLSLTHSEYHSPALSNSAGTAKWSEGNPFSGVQSNGYWSSTSYAFYPTLAWYVYLLDGYLSYTSKPYSLYVWPVRGGQP